MNQAFITNKKVLFVLCFLLFLSFSVKSQVTDSVNKASIDTAKKEFHFSGAINVTNNGISFIPTFSLGQPATIFNLSIGGPKFSFEPELRFSLEGRPWSFIFWWRYKWVNNKKFRFNVGGHPSLSFKTVESIVNGATIKTIQAQRYAAVELVPSYSLTNNFTVGAYYLYSHGLDFGANKNTHFLTINSSISNINLFNDIYMRVTPQLYYLQLDAKDGYYATGTINISKRNWPISFTTIANKIINSTIPSKDFVWNATVVYSFNNKFTRK
jgi:hypothetical protein